MAPPQKQTKTSYVLALPSTLTAAEVVAKAKTDGITLTVMHVHKIRSSARVKAKTSAHKAATKKPAKAPAAKPATAPAVKAPAPAVARIAAPAASGHDAEFVRLVLQMGVERATGLIAKVRERIERLANG